jgi:hypothetical protein
VPSSTSSDAFATAQASGLPMNVGPCASTGSSPWAIPAATSEVHSVAASVRYPPVSALPAHITSGETLAPPPLWPVPPVWPAAKSSPLRPNPVAISSNTSSTPCASQAARNTDKYAGEWNRIPPAPCTTGSTITAASSSACSAIRSVSDFA